MIRDIAQDYEENGLRLLRNLGERHSQERVDTLAALGKASDIAVSVFSRARHDMEAFARQLRDMDVTHTAATLNRPALAQKIDTVARLCQSRLKNQILSGSLQESHPHEEDFPSEPEMTHAKDDDLAEIYRLKLCEAVQQPENENGEGHEHIYQEVDRFIRRCLQGDGESSRMLLPETRMKMTSEKTADEALEVFLDRIMRTLQEDKVQCRSNQVADSDDGQLAEDNTKDDIMGSIGIVG